jgi:tetratricopeptide (TPR) repeat protein
MHDMSGLEVELPTDASDGSPERQSEGERNLAADQLTVANIPGDAPYLSFFDADSARNLVAQFVSRTVSQDNASSDSLESDKGATSETGPLDIQDNAIRLGSAALNAFLQANVTGPVLEGSAKCEQVFSSAYDSLPIESRPKATHGQNSIETLRRICLRSLDVDGVSVYSYIPHIELFCLARWIFTSGHVLLTDRNRDINDLARDLAWMNVRIHLWHYKLLSQPSFGAGSLFTKSGRWTDVASLQELVERSIEDAGPAVLQEVEGMKGSKVQFLLEKANAYIMLGNDIKAKDALRQATEVSGFVYALSGALGKRTRFQEKSNSQLVVLAKSGEGVTDNNDTKTSGEIAPSALPLNDDTLLEKISFSTGKVEDVSQSNLPDALQGLTPENQPRLQAEDQIILLTEATIKDTFSPSDSLTAEEIMPFAARVIDDSSVNWQIYTQALLVRSRIELSRSRTMERGILQMQALVDQVIVDTNTPTNGPAQNDQADGASGNLPIPTIEVSGATDSSQAIAKAKPTSFLPAATPSESASPQVRLRYVNALSSPPRWHLESELAYGWASIGSLISALEIFKRLRLWPEVALCLAASAATEDEDGRGSGGEEKARAIVRWQLFHHTGESSNVSNPNEDELLDTDNLKFKDYYGPERNPPPPNAPRLFCILGDMEREPKHYERAWEVSNRRFGRAQKSLGELYLQQKDWAKAREAYKLAVGVNRLSPELWSRLGDIALRLGDFPDAADAFQRGIGASNDQEGGEGARTWSNLGTALLSWYREIVKENKGLRIQKSVDSKKEDDDEDDATLVANDDKGEDETAMPATARAAALKKPAYTLIQDALTAFKRGATIANSNWRIWDNVISLAASLSPKPALEDVILGTSNVLRIRNSEDAIDGEVLSLLLREITKEPATTHGDGIYDPPRGSLQSRVISLFEDTIVPLITTNSEAWSLVSRLRAWRRDYAGALDAAEKGWRAATGGASGSTLSASAGTSSTVIDWQTDASAWETVVERTGELVAAYENYGPNVESIGTRWKGKARSAVRSIMGKAKENWEGSPGWTTLDGLMADLKI